MNPESKQEHRKKKSADKERLGRRDFFAGLGKGSKVVIAAAIGGAVIGGSRKADAGRWVNRRVGGGAWANRRVGGGAWANRAGGGGWVNRRVGGGAWVNRR